MGTSLCAQITGQGKTRQGKTRHVRRKRTLGWKRCLAAALSCEKQDDFLYATSVIHSYTLKLLLTKRMGAIFVDKATQEAQAVEVVEGRVQWAAVEKAFKANAVRLYETPTAPEPIKLGIRNDGLTFRQFQDGSQSSVLVEKQTGPQGQNIPAELIARLIAQIDVNARLTSILAQSMFLTDKESSHSSTSKIKEQAWLKYEDSHNTKAQIRASIPAALMVFSATGSSSCPANVRDMVTGKDLPAETGLCHIYQQRWPPFLLKPFGLKLHDPANTFFTAKPIAKQFDKLAICLMPENGKLKLRVLNNILLKDQVWKDEAVLWSDLDGKEVTSTTGQLPAKRACALHAFMAIQHAESAGVLEEGQIAVPDTAWESPGIDPDIFQQWVNSVQILELN